MPLGQGEPRRQGYEGKEPLRSPEDEASDVDSRTTARARGYLVVVSGDEGGAGFSAEDLAAHRTASTVIVKSTQSHISVCVLALVFRIV